MDGKKGPGRVSDKSQVVYKEKQIGLHLHEFERVRKAQVKYRWSFGGKQGCNIPSGVRVVIFKVVIV